MIGMLLGALLGCGGAEPADLLLEGGTIHTSLGASTHAVAVRDGVVVATGDDAVDLLGDGTRSYDLDGGTATAGFHDSHTHLLPGSFVMRRILLLGVSSMQRMSDKVADYAGDNPDEPWIVGFGWLVGDLPDGDGRLLDAVTGDRPALLIAGSGHSVLVNSKAMELAGIDDDTPDPAGGVIVRDGDGHATGMLHESAMALVVPLALTAYDDDAIRPGLVEELSTFSAGGLTGISEILAAPGVSIDRPWIYTELEAEGLLDVRVHYYLPVFEQADLARIDEARGEHDTDLVRFAGAKLWVDGSLASLEGWTNQPYATSGTTGSHYFEPDTLQAIVLEAEERGIALKLHAMGDAAVDNTLTALEAVSDARGGLEQTHTLEHVVLASPAAQARMAALGVVSSMQPVAYGVATLADWHEELDEWTVEQSHDWRGMADAGIPLALGTDWPVWPTANSQVTLWAATSNHGDGSLSAAEALDAYTAGSARSVGMAGQLGCLEVGCLADIVVLDVDVLDAAPEAISAAEIQAGWVGGRKVQ